MSRISTFARIATASLAATSAVVALATPAGAKPTWVITRIPAPPAALVASDGSPGPSPAAGRPFVDGNILRASDGSRYVIKGVAAYLMPFTTAAGGGPDPAIAEVSAMDFANRDQIFAAMRAIGINTVRIPVGQQALNGDPYGLGGTAGYVQRLSEIVRSADGAGLRVIVGWWDSMGEGSSWPAQAAQDFGLMGQVVGALRSDPNVLFEPWNEPNGVTWGQWLTTMTATLGQFRTVFGYRGVLFIDTVNWSWDFDPAEARLLQAVDAGLNAGRSDLVFANHRYANGNSCFCGQEAASWQSEIGQYVSTFPIVGTEYGYWNGPQSSTEPTWNLQLLSALAAKVSAGFNGYSDFVWDWVDPNTMVGNPGFHAATELTQLNQHGEIAETFFRQTFS